MSSVRISSSGPTADDTEPGFSTCRHAVYVLRHGATVADGRDLVRKATPLSPIGIQQIEEAARRLSEMLPAGKPAVVVSARLRRALMSASIIRARLEAAMLVDPRLDELDFGWEEESLTDFLTRVPADRLQAFQNWPHRVPLPGAESFERFQRRVACAYAALQPLRARSSVVVVAHDGVNRLLTLLAHRLPLDAWRQIPPWRPGELRLLEAETSDAAGEP